MSTAEELPDTNAIVAEALRLRKDAGVNHAIDYLVGNAKAAKIRVTDLPLRLSEAAVTDAAFEAQIRAIFGG